LRAVEKGKIKVRKVDDNTSAQVEILIHLAVGASLDKTIDALYAFTDCEVNVSPNCCVIDNQKPHFLSVSDVVRKAADNTVALLRQELEIDKEELQERLHFATLEKIFIEERIYKDEKFEQAKNMDDACEHINDRLIPFYPQLIRKVTKNDILKLMDIKMGRILKFNSDKAEGDIAGMKVEIEKIDKHLAGIVKYTIEWFRSLKKKYGESFPRRTKLRNFETIEAAKVIEANEKLYVNEEEGFMGTSLKKDKFITNCSGLDDVIIFYKDGRYIVTPVTEKKFIGKDVLYINIFQKNDIRTVYNVVYIDGKTTFHYIKRFTVTALIRDREYNISQGNPNSRIVYFTANPNGEAEEIKVSLKNRSGSRKLSLEKDFSTVIIKGRSAAGAILTKFEVSKIVLKRQGGSTLGGQKVWFDHNVLRLNYEERGEYLGEFNEGDTILVVLDNGDFYTTNFDLSNHYEHNVKFLKKYNPQTIWTAIIRDADQNNAFCLKRFYFEPTTRKQNYIGENKDSQLVILTFLLHSRFEITFGGKDSSLDPMIINSEEFPLKSIRTKGKRLSAYTMETIKEIESTPILNDNEETEDKVDDTGQREIF
jgi:topoisomerase-4 subunit A